MKRNTKKYFLNNYWQSLSPIPNPKIPKPQNQGTGAVTIITGDSVEEVSLYYLGGDPIPYIGLVPIDPRSS